MARCLACGSEPTEELPTICSTCFIPVPSPVGKRTDLAYDEWMQSSEGLAQQIFRGTAEGIAVVEKLGLSHLPISELAAALTAVAMEKLHLLSTEFDLVEGRFLIGLGAALARSLGDEKLTRVCELRLAWYETLAGYLSRAEERLSSISLGDLGGDITRYGDGEQVLSAMEDLHVASLLALVRTLQGESVDTSALLEGTGHLWEIMRPEITRIIVNREQRSFLVGASDASTRVPRLDKLAFVQVVLVNQAIAASTGHFSDEVIEALMTLGRMVTILGEMSPPDDPPFYAAVLREYLLLFNGIMWFEEALRENDLDLVQRAILQGHAISIQWSELLQAPSWMQVRPSRTLEIFYRATRWSDQLSPSPFLKKWRESADEVFIPFIDYVNAEALWRVGHSEEAIELLIDVLDREVLDEGLRTAGTLLLQKILLDSDGIALDVPHQRRTDVLQVFLEVPSGLGNLLDSQVRLPSSPIGVVLPPSDSVLALVLGDAREYLPRSVSVKGEVMEDLIYRTPDTPRQHLNQTILVVGTSYFKDVHWMTPFSAVGRSVNGVRTDVVLLRIKKGEDLTSLLFEADHIEVTERDGVLYIGTPAYFHLVGVDSRLPADEVLELLVSVLHGVEGVDQLDIYTLAVLS